MNRKAKKRALRIRLTVVYSLMTVAILMLVAGLYFIIQGYRFNWFDGKIEQGGLVQFNTAPTGADVWLDQTRLANKTQSKLTVSTGNHSVTMQKQGYLAWKKDVTVRAGQILWLDYARLVPSTLSPENVVQLTTGSNGKISYDTKTYAIIENPSEPNLTLVGLDDTTPAKRQLVLPESAYTLPAEGETQAFTLYAWAYDNRYLLIKHTYGEHTEWISFNTADGKTAKNLTHVLGINAIDVQYAKDDANTLLMLDTSGDVRKTNIDQKTVSGPLVQNVHDFTMFGTTTIVYTTNQDPTTHVRTAGYLTIGATAPRAVYQAPADDTSALHISINKYYGKVYQVVSLGDNLTIYTGDLVASDTKDPAPFAQVAAIDSKSPIEYLGFSPDQHRFVYAGGGNHVLSYDLDLGTSDAIILQAPPQTGVDWIDEYHFVTIEDSTLRMYDYDGTNGHDMMKNVVASDVSLLQSGKYLNAITATDGVTHLTRVKMIID